MKTYLIWKTCNKVFPYLTSIIQDSHPLILLKRRSFHQCWKYDKEFMRHKMFERYFRFLQRLREALICRSIHLHKIDGHKFYMKYNILCNNFEGCLVFLFFTISSIFQNEEKNFKVIVNEGSFLIWCIDKTSLPKKVN